MPQTVNGIGTWYHGKNNRHTRRASCEFCGHFGDLASYDTTLFVVVLYVPIIPLKRMHVLDECPSCHKHRSLKLKEWEKLRDDALNETLSAYSAAPNDEEKAVAAIGTAIFYRVQGAFEQLAPAVRRSLPRSAKALAALGEAYDFFGNKGEAEQCYRESLK